MPRPSLAGLGGASFASLANTSAINFTFIANMKEVVVMTTHNSRSLKAVIVAAVFLLAGFAMPGLSHASTGAFQINNALTQNLDMDHFNSGYHYYVLMDAGNPYAIVGLQKGYRISAPYWKAISLDSSRFSHLAAIDEDYPILGSITYGAYILDSHNRRIGTWYSSYMAGEAANQQTKMVSITLHHNWLLN